MPQVPELLEPGTGDRKGGPRIKVFGLHTSQVLHYGLVRFVVDQTHGHQIPVHQPFHFIGKLFVNHANVQC